MNKYLKFDDVKDINSLKEYLRNIHELACLSYNLGNNCNLVFDLRNKDENCAGEVRENISNKITYNIHIYHLEELDKVETLNLLNAYFHELNHILFDTKLISLFRYIADTVECCIIEHENIVYQELHDYFLAEIEAIQAAQDTVLDIVLKSNFELDLNSLKFLMNEQLHVIDTEYYYKTYYLKEFINVFNDIVKKDIKDKELYLDFLNIFYFKNGLPKSIDAVINNKDFYLLYKNNRPLLYNFLSSDVFISELKRENISKEARVLLEDVLYFNQIQEERVDQARELFYKNETTYNDYINNVLEEFQDNDNPKSYYIRKIKNLKNAPKTK